MLEGKSRLEVMSRREIFSTTTCREEPRSQSQNVAHALSQDPDMHTSRRVASWTKLMVNCSTGSLRAHSGVLVNEMASSTTVPLGWLYTVAVRGYH